MLRAKKKGKKFKKKKIPENDDLTSYVNSEEEFVYNAAVTSERDTTKDFIFSDHDNSSGSEIDAFEDSVETLINDPKNRTPILQHTPTPDQPKRPANSPPLASTDLKKQRSL